MANLTRYTHQTTRAAELVRLPSISARDLDPETKLFKKKRPDPGIWPTDGFRKSGLVWSIPESDHPPDLANGGPESTRDPINPLRRTWLYRIFRRRAHHLPPDPNILKSQTPKLKKCPNPGLGKFQDWAI